MKISYRYWTKTPGIGGKITTPEDFIVKEIISPKFMRKYGRTTKGVGKIRGSYSLFMLKKRGMTTHEAVKRMAKILKIKENLIGYAGLKDRFAVTYQYITIRGMPKEIKEKNIELSFIKKTDKFISPGDLVGNEFIITLHGCRNNKNLEKIIRELNTGMPNYFGLQRFGSSRKNHIIGMHLVKRDFSSALKLINSCGYNYKKIHAVPKKMLKFFINAYQSWIFNEELNELLDKKTRPFPNQLKLKAFSVPELLISCRGGERKLFINIRDISFIKKLDEVKISFILPKGSYATVLLRELTKQV